MSKLEEIQQLVCELNTYRNSYYNDNKSLIGDKDYDTLYDKLVSLEKETNIILANSPTQNVGYEVVSELTKVTHTEPLLSLDKTKDISDIIKYSNKGNLLLMHKLDGLTMKLTYDKGELVMAETRGDGIIGEDVTHNARTFSNIPIKVSKLDKFSVIGEAIIKLNNFERINIDGEYKNSRNLVSGSVRQLDANICKQRYVEFHCWNANELSQDDTMINGLNNAKELGFNIVELVELNGDNSFTNINAIIDKLKANAQTNYIPIDGIVCIYNSISYGKSLGSTAHHLRNAIAYKFYDDEFKTVLRNIEWQVGKTGDITPIAVFDAVDIDGTSVTRASLHNVNTLQSLGLNIGDTITVIKANMIIPQVTSNLTSTISNYEIPKYCPICGNATTLEINQTKEKDVKVLKCYNNNCKGKLLSKLTHFVSKPCMNIDGLSESTLQKIIDLGYINSIIDIYDIPNKCSNVLLLMPGFGQRSIDNLNNAIEKSKIVNLSNFINALSIPLVGKNTAELIAKECNYKLENFIALKDKDITHIDGVGPELQNSLNSWLNNVDNQQLLKRFSTILTIKDNKSNNISNKLNNLNFVITGKLNNYSRDELTSIINNNGGRVQSTVSSNTNYLINNDINSNSSKNKKAKQLNIPIISEQQFIDMFTINTSKLISTSIINTNTKTNTLRRKKLF